MTVAALKRLAALAAFLALACAAPPQYRDMRALLEMDGFQKILERGEIPPVNEPIFIPAAEADIADDAWVIGVYAGKEAKAYSINLLNEHEVVNDLLDGAPIATTW